MEGYSNNNKSDIPVNAYFVVYFMDEDSNRIQEFRGYEIPIPREGEEVTLVRELSEDEEPSNEDQEQTGMKELGRYEVVNVSWYYYQPNFPQKTEDQHSPPIVGVIIDTNNVED